MDCRKITDLSLVSTATSNQALHLTALPLRVGADLD